MAVGPVPVVTVSPEGPYVSGMFVTLTCTTVDVSRNIVWIKDNLDFNRVMIEGLMVVSTLNIMGLIESDEGQYVCRVGPVRANFTLDVFVPTTSKLKWWVYRHACINTYIQTDRQTDGWTDGHTYTHTHTHT